MNTVYTIEQLIKLQDKASKKNDLSLCRVKIGDIIIINNKIYKVNRGPCKHCLERKYREEKECPLMNAHIHFSCVRSLGLSQNLIEVEEGL